MTTLRRTIAVVLTTAVLAATLLAPTSPATAQQAPPLGPTSYSANGKYAVGERTVKLPSGVKVELWYPARKADVKGKKIGEYDVADWLPDFLKSQLPPGVEVTYPSGGVRGVPVAPGKFPLVVFSHGFAGFRTQSSALTAAIASWGFVVAAPDHPSRNLTKVMFGPAGTTTDVEDLQDTITMVAKQNKTKGSWLRKHVLMSQIGALGHSAGGRAVESLASVDKRVDTFIGMAPAHDPELAPVQKPSLVIAATGDGIISLDKIEATYETMAAPKRIVVTNGGHLVYSDLCEVGSAEGGLLEIAEAVGITVPQNLIPLATDGCYEPALAPPLAWPAVQHVVVAHLRRVFGTDATDAAFTGLVEAYPGIVTDSRSAQ
ncbi:dienelactone hydrolase family protein [Nocardioides sp. SR21]|uniref:alpha/beta hydrolase family protein n=1 Tax=Nocardioides sp. SR21 TaxID=2919501 RepID=UPI001FAA7489|nr:dienelactone hydrolase family protein [Nocardioides sp. SR21]